MHKFSGSYKTRLDETLEQNQKLRTQWEQAQREDKKDELYWKEKCLDNQAQLLEVQKKEVEGSVNCEDRKTAWRAGK